MSFITAIQPILNARTASVKMEVSANPHNNEEMVVVIKPVVGQIPDSAPETLVQLISALAMPIKVIAHPMVIESELVAAIQQQADTRESWAQRAAQIESQIQASDKGGKKATASTPAPSTGAPASTENTQATTADEDNLELEL
jgi:PRTRC genetic system protein E